jgi:hypothetical protein
MKLEVLISVLVLGIASAKADDKFMCPVTKPVPAAMYAGQFTLVGTEELFTLFDRRWQLPLQTGSGYSFRKIVWGTATFDMKPEVGHSSLSITGRRLDADSGPLQFGGASAVSSPFEPVPKEERKNLSLSMMRGFMPSHFYVPTSGCWEVTGHFHGTDLTIVVDLK